MSNELAKRVTSLDEEFEEAFTNSLMMTVVMVVIIIGVIGLIMPMITQQVSASYSRVQTLSTSPGTIAQNVGVMWYEITPLGQPNRLKMIGENSTGAFEEILVSLST